MSSNNVFLGNKSAKNTKIGNNNVFVGSETGEYSLLVDDSTFIGSKSGQFCKGGINNIFIGSNAGMYSEHNDCIIFGDLKHTPENEYLSIANVIEGFNIYNKDHNKKIINLKGNVLLDGITSVRNLIASEPIPQVVQLQDITYQTFETNTTIVNANFSDVNEELDYVDNRLNAHSERLDDIDYIIYIFQNEFEDNVDRIENLLDNQQSQTSNDFSIFRSNFKSNIEQINKIANNDRKHFEDNIEYINEYLQYHDNVLDGHSNRIDVLESGNVGSVDVNTLYTKVNTIHESRLNDLDESLIQESELLTSRIEGNDLEIHQLRQISQYSADSSNDVNNSEIHFKESGQNDYVIKSENGLLKIGRQSGSIFTTLHIFK